MKSTFLIQIVIISMLVFVGVANARITHLPNRAQCVIAEEDGVDGKKKMVGTSPIIVTDQGASISLSSKNTVHLAFVPFGATFLAEICNGSCGLQDKIFAASQTAFVGGKFAMHLEAKGISVDCAGTGAISGID